MTHKLPDLPYDYSALEPAISGEIMELHHSKHHNTYVMKLNEALEKYAEAQKNNDVSAMISLQSAINFNGGGHINHSIFWTNLAPQSQGGGEPPSGALAEQITKVFGSFDGFKETFSAKTALIQGSGWGWLAYCKASKSIVFKACANQDPLEASTGLIPLLGVDVWEHAYYLQYKNVRPDYLKAIWSIVNWKNVEDRYSNAIN